MNEGVPTYILRQTAVRKVDPKMGQHRQTLVDSARQSQCLQHGEQRHPREGSRIGRELRCRAGRRGDAGHCQREKHRAGSLGWSGQAGIVQQQASCR
jgi:hypothetical protein